MDSNFGSNFMVKFSNFFQLIYERQNLFHVSRIFLTQNLIIRRYNISFSFQILMNNFLFSFGKFLIIGQKMNSAYFPCEIFNKLLRKANQFGDVHRKTVPFICSLFRIHPFSEKSNLNTSEEFSSSSFLSISLNLTVLKSGSVFISL